MRPPRLQLPATLAAAVMRDGLQEWAAGLPAALAEMCDAWDLTIGDPFQPGGKRAWVAPALDADGTPLVLKLGWRHRESLHEADGLREWNGDGAVILHATRQMGDTTALLLERCEPGTLLSSLPEPEQDVVIARQLTRLWRTPATGHPCRPLRDMCDDWADSCLAKGLTAPWADRGLLREGAARFRELAADGTGHVLLGTDVHAGNVLAAQREPWLVIDPKPYVGDPTYDPLQHLLNCEARLTADPEGLARQVAGLCSVDPDRLVQWLFARCVVDSVRRPSLAAIALALQT
jgi:streptomycin 6-kinase